MHLRAPGVVACLLVLLSSCGGTDETPSATPSSPTSTTSSPASTSTPSEPPETTPREGGARLITKGSVYGPMLFDGRGQAIYLFEPERTSEPRCYDACAEAWPPVLTQGAPQAGGGVRPALLGTTRRRDGSRQVTYAGHPLYYYAHEGVGQVLCHDVVENGGLWLVVAPSGEPGPH